MLQKTHKKAVKCDRGVIMVPERIVSAVSLAKDMRIFDAFV